MWNMLMNHQILGYSMVRQTHLWFNSYFWDDGKVNMLPWNNMPEALIKDTRPGEQPHSHGKIHHFFLMGKSTISMAIFHCKLLVHQRASEEQAVAWVAVKVAIWSDWFTVQYQQQFNGWPCVKNYLGKPWWTLVKCRSLSWVHLGVGNE